MAKLTVRGLESLRPRDDAYKVVVERGLHIRVAPDGKKLSFDITIPSGYTDWVTMTKLLRTQLQQVGIDIIPQGVSSTTWSNDLHAGTFQISLYYPSIGNGPYDLYRSFMSKELSAPAGESATLNYGRWEDPQTEQYLAAYGNTGDKATQKAAIQAKAPR